MKAGGVNARTMVLRIIISTGKSMKALKRKKKKKNSRDLKIQQRDGNDEVAYKVN